VGYTFAVTNLAKLTDAEFQGIPPCNRDVVELREPGKIASREQAWLYELCKDISPARDESHQAKRPWPRYIPELAVKKGGEALLIRTWDQWRQHGVMLKVPLPVFCHDTQRVKRQDVHEPREPRKIERSASGLQKVARSLFRRLEPPKQRGGTAPGEVREFPKKSPAEIEEEERQARVIAESTKYKRFHTSFLVQEQLHRKANRADPNRMYGYVPKTFEFGCHPKCFFTQEFIAGQGYLEYLRGHSDSENFALFLRAVIFVEKVIHDMGVAHCDLAPRNILVIGDGIPVILDFGIVKGNTLEEITLDTAQLGSIAFSSPGQLANSRNRSFVDDIFSLGRMLWATCARRVPNIEGILAEYDDQGKIVVEREAVAALFDAYSIPDDMRGIFKLSQEGGYTDISEFRKDLEGLFFSEETQGPIVSVDTERLDDLEKRVNKIEGIIPKIFQLFEEGD
jgi:serine/threonine protein kinase